MLSLLLTPAQRIALGLLMLSSFIGGLYTEKTHVTHAAVTRPQVDPPPPPPVVADGKCPDGVWNLFGRCAAPPVKKAPACEVSEDGHYEYCPL